MAESTAASNTAVDSSNGAWYSRSELRDAADISHSLLSQIETQFRYVDRELTQIRRKNGQLSIARYPSSRDDTSDAINADGSTGSAPDGAAAIGNTQATVSDQDRVQADNVDSGVSTGSDEATDGEPRGTEIESSTLTLNDEDAEFIMVFLPHVFEHLAPNGLDPRQQGTMRFSIGLSKSVFDQVMEAFQIHPLFLEALYSRVGQYGIVDTADLESGNSILHFIVKVPPAGHLEAGFYIRYETKTGKMRIVIAGDELASHAQDVLEYLQVEMETLDPFALTLILVRRYYYFLDLQSIQVDHAVIMTERETGRGAVAYSDGRPDRMVSPDKFDLTFMYWIEGNQRNIVYASQFQSRLADFLISEHMMRARSGKASAAFLSETYHSLPAKARSLHARFLLHQTAVDSLHSASLTMRERIQRQLSAADSLINQYDNKVSLDNAAANTTIAEQSRRIADESRKIAIETQRDSTSMKTIASLTMVYLPITFTASIFSTGFFSYGDDGLGAVSVNSQIWMLFMVGLILTVITLAVWILLNKHGIPKQLAWARQEVKPVSTDIESSITASNSQPVPIRLSTFQQGPRPPLQVFSNPKVDLPLRPMN
ncbi:MAG: hypothetical protein GOMPHAMPRED_005971 [Gomphillus americanus]|uniref:Uncharacterized protein n=1 Tax=Gomphillus americanus TaxID=1940652 RepID=A0A8H3FVN7_9LECA|nr:MAG: hypothetical protein GOMPHAMPRED_005971 [Gomphillus americanus]